MTIEILDPTYGEGPSDFAAAPRLATLAGVTVGIISNGKHGTGRFFDAVAHHLQTQYRVQAVERVVKPNYSAPAGDDIMDATKHWHAVISGIGD
jgi:hypothetical protein